MAAGQGHPKSLYNIALASKKGEGTPKDLKLAYAYFKIAKLPSEKVITSIAQDELDEIAVQLKATEIEAAEAIVSNYKLNPTPVTLESMNSLTKAKALAVVSV